MISSLKHYLDAQVFRIVGILLLFFVICVDGFAQSQSIGHGVYSIFNDYARTHWKSADSIDQIIDHISSFPKWKRKDIKESITYLQLKNGYIYHQDSINCYFDSDVCTFVLPLYVQPCELVADTSVDAFLRKLKVSSVCFDKEGHVIYSANHFCEHRLAMLRKKMRENEPQTAMHLRIWIPVVVKKESQTVQNYCTQENVDPNIQTLVLRYVQSIWRRHPEVHEVRFGLFIG